MTSGKDVQSNQTIKYSLFIDVSCADSVEVFSHILQRLLFSKAVSWVKEWGSHPPFYKLYGNFQHRRWTGLWALLYASHSAASILWTLLYASHSAASILWTLPELNLGTALPLSNIFSYSAEIQASAQALIWPLPRLATIYSISRCKG